MITLTTNLRCFASLWWSGGDGAAQHSTAQYSTAHTPCTWIHKRKIRIRHSGLNQMANVHTILQWERGCDLSTICSVGVALCTPGIVNGNCLWFIVEFAEIYLITLNVYILRFGFSSESEGKTSVQFFFYYFNHISFYRMGTDFLMIINKIKDIWSSSFIIRLLAFCFIMFS